jgi:hypothetical protein
MRRLWFLSSVLLVALLAACGSSQDAIDLAVCQTQQAVPTGTPAVVTVLETVVVETTREIEVTREVEIEVEVTREVTRVVEVERIITATPAPTLTPTNTPTPEPTSTVAPRTTWQPAPTVPPGATSRSTLLAAMMTARADIGGFGFMIDQAGDPASIECEEVVDAYNLAMEAPVFSYVPNDLEPAYSSYRAAVEIFQSGAADFAGLCQDLIDGKRDKPISLFIWTRARTAVNDALDVLNPAISSLE